MATTKRKTKLAPQPATNETVANGSHPPVGGEGTTGLVTASTDDPRAKLDELATEIRSGHGRCVEALREVVSQAAGIGKLLNEAKKLVGHGGWKAWVETHCRFAMRMAQNYMLIARNHERLVAKFGNDAAGWTLTEFIKMAQKFETEAQKKPQPTTTKGDTSIPNPVPEPFRLPAGEVTERQRRFQTEVRGTAAERVAKDEALTTFVRGRLSALYTAVRRFVSSKEVVKLAGEGLDAADLGMLLVDRLKESLDPSEVFVAVPGVPSQPTDSGIQTPGGAHQTNGVHREVLSV